MSYQDFIQKKAFTAKPCGFEPRSRNEKLFDWQNDIVTWATMHGKSSIFSDCGTGKTAMQLQYAAEVHAHTGKPVLILAPLAVARQTKREGEKFNIAVNVCRSQDDVKNMVNVTNYDMLHKFNAEAFGGIVLDESSILKHHTSKTRQQLTSMFENTSYKLACTATPSPNDYMELGTHSHFMGVMTQPEMLSTFFVHDGGDTAKWRLKGHAESSFFEWIASWACCLRRPQDLGYEQAGFDLPELRLHEITIDSDMMEDASGQFMLLPPTAMSLNERRKARRDSIADRIQAAADIANATSEQVLVWCDMNAESAGLTKAINGAVEVCGAMSPEAKENAMLGFSDGANRVLVSKPSIAGWGMNWQQCSKMIFVGLSDSFEAYYQAVRRCWRYGQTCPVDVYIITSEAEGAVRANIQRKQKDAERMMDELVKFTKETIKADLKRTERMVERYYAHEAMRLPDWLVA